MKLNDISKDSKNDINIENTNKSKLHTQLLYSNNSKIIDNFDSKDDVNLIDEKNIKDIDFKNVSNKNLNDINNFTNKKDVNIKKYFTKRILKISKIKKLLSNDISKRKSNTIKFESQKDIKILQNNNKYSDSVVKNSWLKDIYIFKRFNLLDLFSRKKIFQIKLRYLFNIKQFRITRKFIKRLLILFLFFISFLIVDKFLVELTINSWYQKLLEIKNNSKDIAFIQKKINDAKFNFIIWDFLYKPFLIIPNQNIKNWYHIIKWWKHISFLGDNLLHTYDLLDSLFKEKWIENIKNSNLILNLESDLLNINKLLKDAYDNYNSVVSFQDDEIKKKIDLLNYYLLESVRYSDYINSNLNTILDILWHNKEKKYLVVLQNTDEIRPTGWFMWSMWILSIFRWKVKSFEMQDVYAIEWKIKDSQYSPQIPPEWINRITPEFLLRDANYFLDIKDSSNKINEFIKEAWYSIDWIIYLNQNTILDALKISWWIKLDDIEKEINYEDFSWYISTLVESKVSKVWTLWTPKQILFDFAEKFKQKVLSDKNYADYLKIIFENIKSRDIVFYSFDEKENDLIKYFDLWWVIDFNQSLDFSYPVFTSISWNKSDRYVKRKFLKDVKINDDCSIETNIDIYNSHLFMKKDEEKISSIIDEFSIKDKNKILSIQWAGNNRQYVRVILPKEAIIEENNQLTINDSLIDKKIVSFYMNTQRTQTTNTNIKYKLENENCMKYDYYFYKQAWIKDYSIEINNNDEITKQNELNKDFYFKLN